jgi:uncharacterized protein YdhG (YjbR/CyaY superfamily)
MKGRGYPRPALGVRRRSSFSIVIESPFDAYLAAQPEPQRSTLAAVAVSLRSLLPDAEACISYGMPAFKCDGTAIAGFAGFKEHCSYFPHSGDVIPTLLPALAKYDADAGTLRFPIDTPLPLAVLRKLVVARIRVENEHAPRGNKVRQFYDNGRLKSTGSVRDGEMHGAWQFFRTDGSLMRSGKFDLGRQVGVWRTFDRNDSVVKETSFR